MSNTRRRSTRERAKVQRLVSYSYVRPWRVRARPLEAIMAREGVKRAWVRYVLVRITLTRVVGHPEASRSRVDVCGWMWTQAQAEAALERLRHGQ